MSHPLQSSSSSASVTTRSRTLLFLSYRDSKARAHRFRRPSAVYDAEDTAADAGEDARLITPHAVALDVAPLPPEWVDVSDRVAELLRDADGKIARLEKLHAKHVLPGFADRSQEERDIAALTAAITRDFRHASSLVHRITTTSPSSYPPTTTKGADAAARNVQRALAAKVQDASAAFRKRQRVYMDKLAGHATKNQDLLVAAGNAPAPSSRLSVEDDLQSSHQDLQQAQLDPALAARTAEIAHLAQSIAGLAELFKDLGALVVEQGTILDSVEYNIEQAAVELDQANAELKVAQRYQRNTGRRSCIFLLVLLIVGTILVIIFKPRRAHSSSSSPAPSAPVESQHALWQ